MEHRLTKHFRRIKYDWKGAMIQKAAQAEDTLCRDLETRTSLLTDLKQKTLDVLRGEGFRLNLDGSSSVCRSYRRGGFDGVEWSGGMYRSCLCLR